MSKIKQEGNITQYFAGKGYSEHIQGKPLISVENTGNGFHITQHSYSSVHQDMHYSIDYSLAHELMKVLKYLDKQEKERLNGRI